MNKRFNKLSLAVSLALVSSVAAAQQQVVYSGTMKAQAPKPDIIAPEIGYYAGVKRYVLEADPAAEICSFESSAIMAANGLDGENWRCHFEWTDTTDGFFNEGTIKDGIFPASGEIAIPYEVSVYSGSTGNKVVVHSGKYTVSVQEPAAPEILSIEGVWSVDNKTGFEQDNYNAKDELSGLKVKLAPKPYDQLLSFDGSKCKVREGSEACSIYIPKRQFGDPETNIQGTETIPFDVDSITDYFTQPINDITVNWDYRPPSLAAMDYHVGANVPDSKTITVSGTDIEIPKEQAVIALTSPHIAKTEQEFWQLGDQNFYLSPSEGAEQSSMVMVGDNRIRFNVPNYNWRDEYRIRPISQQRMGDLYVYRYDLSEIPDGKFDTKINVQDKYKNGDVVTSAENLIDRFPPALKTLKGNRELSYGGDVYFTSDLGAAATGGWDDGTKITSMSLGGIDLPIEGLKPNIQHAAANLTSELTPNETYDFVVTAEDGAGNTASKTLEMRFNPSGFFMSGKPEQLHQNVQKATIYVNQNSGRCTLASSDEVAALISQDYRKSCTIEWGTIPNGMETSFLGWTNAVVGAASDLGTNNLEYSVYYHNPEGTKIRMYGEQASFEVVPHDSLELSIDGRKKLADGVFGRSQVTASLGKYQFKTNPAAVTVTQTVQGSGETETKEFGQLPFDRNYEMSGNIQDPQTQARALWERVSMDVTAAYSLHPEYAITETVEFIQLPNAYVGAYLSLPDTGLKSTDLVPLTIDVGRYDSADDVVNYDVSTMGVWDVYPALKVDGEYVPLEAAQTIDETGTATINVDGNALFEDGGALYAVADVQSPHTEFSKQIVSSPKYIEVLKGTAVEGELGTRSRTGRVPFYANVQFQYSSLEDREVAENLRWEISEDGQNWIVDPDLSERTYASFRLTEPDNVYLRVKVDNKTTGETTVSETIELASYATARLGFQGPRQLYSGQQGEFTLTNYSEPLAPTDGQAQWSTDGGETWTDGGVTERFSFSQVGEVVELKARWRFNTTADIVGAEGWSEGTYYVQAVEPRALSISSNVPSLAEAGTPMTVRGFARNPYSSVPSTIVSEWVMPNGDVVSESETTYTVTADELLDTETLDFTYRAWVKGYKEQTYAERIASTRGWNYEFPDMTLTMNTSVSVAPSNIYAAIHKPFVFAPGVEFGYEWIIDETKSRIEYQSGRTALIIAEEPGMQQVQVRAFDNRGNEQMLTGYIDIVKAEDMTGQLKVYPSNRYYRAPLILNSSASADPGHPRDYATSFEWSLNGEVVEAEGSSVNRMEIAEPGVYDVSVKITTQYGQVSTFNEQVTIVPNEKPVCEPVMEESDTYITLKTNCTDNDGRIIAYRWIWNGVEQGPYGTQIRFNKLQFPTLNVQFFAVDDSGGETQGEFNW